VSITTFSEETPTATVLSCLSIPSGTGTREADYMRTSLEFRRNPMGTYVDPQQMMAAHKAGATGAELHRRATAGAFPPAHPMNPQVLL